MASLALLMQINQEYDSAMMQKYPCAQQESTPFDGASVSVLSKTTTVGQQHFPMDNAYMIGEVKTDTPRNIAHKILPAINLPSKTRYIAGYVGSTLSVALLISAIALMSLHHGLPDIHTILQDEIALAPTLAGILAGAAMITGTATVVHYQQRKEKAVKAHSIHPLMQEAKSSDL